MSEKFQILTRKEYDFFEVSSAFQKSIRRGVEKNALFFGTELAGSGYAQYLWKRMMIISSEDIGLANPNCAVQIQALYQNWLVISAKNHEEAIIPIVNAILLLCRSEKSRIVDNAKMFCLKSDYNPKIPDYALDVHTRRGKMMGRSYQFFLDEGRKIENEKVIEKNNEYEAFFEQYLNDYQQKKCTINGYDEKNVYHKSIADMSNWKNENSKKNQSKLFNENE